MRISVFLLRTLALVASGAAIGSAAAQTPSIYRYLSPGLAPGGVGDQSGFSVSRDGEWMAVGRPGYDDTTAADSGLVDIYRWGPGTRWRLLQSLRLSVMPGESPQANARFGTAVSVSGSRVLIGCPGCSGGRAKAYLVELQEPTLPPTFYKLFPALISDADNQLGIGSAVALSGSVVAVGAPLARSALKGVERGAVATGRFDGSGVTWEDILFGPESPAGSRFGQALALAATAGSSPLNGYRSLLIGAPTYVNSGGFGLAGRGYLYQRGNLSTSWDYQQQFANASPGLADAMGSSVAISRDSNEVNGYLVLGAPGRSVEGTPGGGAFVYSRPVGENLYGFESLIQHPDAASGDRFGIAVGVDGPRIVVGADSRARSATVLNEGRGYVFQRLALPAGISWPWREDLGFPGIGDVNLGRSLSMSTNMAILGAPSTSSDSTPLIVVYICDAIFAYGQEAVSTARSCAVP